MYALRFNPEGTTGDDVVVIPGTVSFSAGISNWTLEFSLALDSLPSTGNWYLLGSSAATTNAGFCLRSASGSGVFSIISGGTHIAAADSPTGFIIADGTQHTYKIQRFSGTAISFWRDGLPILENKTWSTSTVFGLTLNRFGRGSVSGTGVNTPMDLAWFDITGNSMSNGQKWDADLSSGTGTLLLTTSGNNQGTLTNFSGATDSWWIYYSTSEDHFGTFTAAASISRALSFQKESLGSYSRSMALNSSWIVEPTPYGSFSTSYSINKSLVSSKEAVVNKPNQGILTGRSFTQAKEALVNKPNQSLFTGTSFTQAKETLVGKPTQSLIETTGFTQAKEVSMQKPNSVLTESIEFTWEIFYGVGGNFTSNMQLTSTAASSKEPLGSLTSALSTSSILSSSKETAAAFATGLQSGFSGISSEKQALSNIYAEMVSSFSITSSKESGSFFARTMRIDGRLTGGTDEAGRPRIITYSTNILSKRFYQTSATITRIV